MLFYHLLLIFVLLTEYFKTQEKLKVALITFKVIKTETWQQIIFLKLTDYKWIFLKVRSKFLSQHSILLYLFANTSFKFGSILSLFMKNDNLNHKVFVWFHLISKVFWENKTLFDSIVVIYRPMCKQILTFTLANYSFHFVLLMAK